ncbi:hypothetical protein [Geomonas propionica]|uniref:Fibronectin type III domain-containing protein n=1 Tax=Geomonas propionica TaxID=2798582 RepID=A0ABS0YXA3_9BACT|nr:hypothetical protein [Geomonas propionica]MBJ6802574.1 hypothetical protein [Geomonas propionica]
MPVIPELLVAHFQDLGINDFIALLLTHAAKVDAHAAVKDGTPEYFWMGEKLRALAAELGQWRDAAATGNRDAKAKKLELWDTGKLALAMNIQHFTMLSLHRNDPNILNDTGFELKQKQQTSKPSTNLLWEIPSLALKHAQSASGPISGAVMVLISRPKNAPCELQMSYDPSNESSWGGQGIHQKARIEYTGLEPASRVSFRARLHVDGKTGPWSQVVTIIVL